MIKKYFISIGILSLLLVLSACDDDVVLSEEKNLHNVVSDEFHGVTMRMTVLSEEDDFSTIGIVIDNPQQLPVQSVRSWIQYDTSVLSVSDLEVSEHHFPLSPPGERNLDVTKGLIKIGAAAMRSVEDKEILVATFHIRKESDAPTALVFYDWLPSGDGHAAVLSLVDGTARNILSPPSPLHF